jgi:hypothetical protein
LEDGLVVEEIRRSDGVLLGEIDNDDDLEKRLYPSVLVDTSVEASSFFDAGLKEEEEQEQAVHEEDAIQEGGWGVRRKQHSWSMVDNGWWRERICDGVPMSALTAKMMQGTHQEADSKQGRIVWRHQSDKRFKGVMGIRHIAGKKL